MKTDVTKNIRINNAMPDVPSPGIRSVSIPKIRQQAKYIVIQKIYFANTISFRGNGSAHNKVDALGYCVSFKDTYCKSIKIEKSLSKQSPICLHIQVNAISKIMEK